MLILSLIVSGILLVIVNLLGWKSRYAPGAVFGICTAVIVVGAGIGIGLTAVFVQAIGLFVIACLWRTTSGRPVTYLPATVVVSLLAYGLVYWTSVRPEM